MFGRTGVCGRGFCLTISVARALSGFRITPDDAAGVGRVLPESGVYLRHVRLRRVIQARGSEPRVDY